MGVKKKTLQIETICERTSEQTIEMNEENWITMSVMEKETVFRFFQSSLPLDVECICLHSLKS